MKQKCIFFLSIFILLNPSQLFPQQGNTKLKAGFESGRINTDLFGDGLFFKPFLKISGRKNFKKSFLKIKTHVSSEIMDLQNTVRGIHLFANIEYSLKTGQGFFLISGSAKNQVHFIQSLKKQLFNEINFRLQYSYNFTRVYSFQFKEQLIFREQAANVKSRLSKNILQADLGIKSKQGNLWKIGFFYENINFDYSHDYERHQKRSGPSLEFNHKKLLVFNMAYKFGFYKNSPVRDQQIAVLAGKYLSRKISLFFFAYYLWRLNENTAPDNLEFNPLQSYNNVSIKLGYDLKEKTHLYGKLLYEEQEIFQRGSKISTFQGLLGLQQSF